MGDSSATAMKSVRARLALCALLAAMMLRALVPAGWMPASDPSSGDAFIVICTSSGMKMVDVDGNGVPVEQDKSISAPDGCAFGSTVAFGLAVAPPVASLLASVEAAPFETLHRLDGTSAGFRRVRDPPVPV